MADFKSSGTTDSEKYLAHLCERTFLGLWSYPNLFRDQKNNPKSEGKELCDLMVVCGNDIILFSDKSCLMHDSGDLDRAWKRWYQRAIARSAKQLYGAERWIKEHPERIYLDKGCTKNFPLLLTPINQFNIHRIVVAKGAKERCRRHLGGSGSLVLCPSIIGNDHINPQAKKYAPFHVGIIETTKGFVHILDEVTLDIILKELDTVTDFIRYLRKKEELILSSKLAIAYGEENLLGAYLKETNRNKEHDFVLPDGFSQIMVKDGIWVDLQNRAEYLAKKQADEISYLWDKIINKFVQHSIAKTINAESGMSIDDIESGLRFMALECRFHRRELAYSMYKLVEKTPDDTFAARTIESNNKQETIYVFILFPKTDLLEAEYGKFRREYLQHYCDVTSWKYRDNPQVFGIASESGKDSFGSSFDLVLIPKQEWTEALEQEVKKIQSELNIQQNLHKTHRNVDEYPKMKVNRQHKNGVISKILREVKTDGKRIKRNDPCPCGSGKKFKHCCDRR